MLNFSVICAILLCFRVIYCDGEEGSPHFQIDHKSGKLDILATRTSADIQSHEDNVDLVMKPGESLTPFYTHGVHHEDEHHQRQDMPHDEQGSSKSETNATKEDENVEMGKNEGESSLNNFDGKWMELFKFPKVNRTVDSNVHRNSTRKNETEEQVEEMETAKMMELEHDADVLAKLVEKSSTRNINPDKIKDAAKKLEWKAEKLQNDFLDSMFSRNRTEGSEIEKEKAGRNAARTNDNKSEDKKGSKNEEKEVKNGNQEVKQKEKDNKAVDSKENCSNCGAKIPKAGEKIEGLIVPKLSKGENETVAESENNISKIAESVNDVKVSGTKDIAANDTRIAQSDHVGYFDTEDGKAKVEKGSSNKNDKGNKGKSKLKKEEKNRKGSSDCGPKVPIPGQIKDDGKLLVPKLTGTNETGGNVGFTGGHNDKSEGKNLKKLNGKEEKGDKGESVKEDAKSSNGKDCKNCQGKIPKPGDKDDGKLVVPKLTNENQTEQVLKQSESKEVVNVKIAKSGENESFDLDDDSEEITEDANYDDLSAPVAKQGKEHFNITGRNESRTYFQVHENNSEKQQEAANTTVSRNIDGGYSLSQEEGKTSSNAESQGKEDKSREAEGKDKYPSSNGYDYTKEENFQRVKEGGNTNAASKQEETSAGERKAEKEGDGTSNEMRNNGQKSKDGDGKDKNESKITDGTMMNEDQRAKNVSNVEKQNDKYDSEKSIKSKNAEAKANAVKSADRVETIKQFDKLLSQFLNNSSPEKGKELLKLTWHDLRQRYAKDGKDDGGLKTDNDAKDNRNREMNGTKLDSGGTARMQNTGGTNKLTKAEDFEATVGRIKQKLSLLHELVEYTKMKKQQKLKKKFDPYAGFKRGRI